MVYGLWCCLINQCFILYGSWGAKTAVIDQCNMSNKWERFLFHKVCDHLWGSVAPSVQHFYVVQLWTWLCAVHSGMCCSLMLAGSLMCLSSLIRASAQHILNHSEHAWVSGLLLVISICPAIIKSRAPYPWMFPSRYTCSVHLCLLAMNFHWCDILHMQILDYTANCSSF